MSGIVAIVLVLMLVALAATLVALKRMLYVVPPSQVLVLSGSPRRIGGAVVRYRALRAGRAIRIPMMERVDVLDVHNMTVTLDSVEVTTRSYLPLHLTLVAMVRLAGDEPRLGRALECFLGRSREEVAAIAKSVLTGVLYGVSRQLTPEQIAADPRDFAEQLTAELELSFDKIGLEVEGVRVKQIHDSYGYESSLGR